jgi:cation:H+ antiporter
MRHPRTSGHDPSGGDRGVALTGASAAGDIGVGTILGASFLLCTLAMFVVGIAVWSYQRRRESGDTVKVDIGSAKRDIFLLPRAFSSSAAVSLLSLPFYANVVLAILLVAAYVLFIRQTVKAGGEAEGDRPKSLTLWPSSSKAPLGPSRRRWW